MAAPTLEGIRRDIFAIIDKPEELLSQNKGHSNKLLKSVKGLYDSGKSTDTETSQSSKSLPELIVKGFDDEQIWQQVELDNDGWLDSLVAESSKLLTSKAQCTFKSKTSILAPSSEDSQTWQKSKMKSKGKGKKKPPSHEESNSENEESGSDSDSLLKDDKTGNQSNEDKNDGIGSDKNSSDGSDNGEDDDIEIDKNDKFFDFTGDSDDDLNFDFGALGQKGNLDDKLFEGDEDSDTDHKKKKQNKVADSKSDETKDSPSKKKKSVTFEDEAEEETLSGKKSKSRLLKNFEKREKGKKAGSGGSVVDDAFFKLAELESFLDKEDRREERRIRREQKGSGASKEEDDSEEEEEGEQVDLFAEIDDEDQDLHYDDFFDPPDGEVDRKADDDNWNDNDKDDDWKGNDDENDDESSGEEDSMTAIRDSENNPEAIEARRALQRNLLAGSDSEGEDVAAILGGKSHHQQSTFEKRQEKLKKKITEMEEKMLTEKPWQLTGEVAAGKRPENSLLQENLQFDYTTRLAPEITEQTTKSLEDLIKQRVKDKAWDDVERKVRPKEDTFEYKKRITLDQEKSKLSLGEIYEQEYLKQQQTEEVEKKDPDHEDIKKQMTSLFLKLDALSNFHYTPKHATAEVQVITNQPSIAMEEVAPVAVSDAQLLAPEEIKDKVVGEVKGATEKTKADRFHERQKKKKDKRERQKERDRRDKIVEKLNPGLGNKYSKEKARQQLEKASKGERSTLTVLKDDKQGKSGLTSSKTFFSQLQDEVTTHVKARTAEKRKQKADKAKSGKKLKL